MNHQFNMVKNEIEMQFTGLTLEQKLDLLTEIFILTEDLRHELCHGGKALAKEWIDHVRTQTSIG